MGLILEGKDFAMICPTSWVMKIIWATWTFKVAGTSEGITTMQMDIKIAGITREIFEAALTQAKEGRAHILGEMAKALDRQSVAELVGTCSAHRNHVRSTRTKIRDIIGTGGKVIREIVRNDRRQGGH